MHTKTERRCVACRQVKLSNEMLRVARINSEFIIDFNHKINREISEIRPLEMAILLGFIKKYKKI